MEIPEKYESFDNQKVENIVKGLIKSGVIFSVGLNRVLYRKIQREANKLGYMKIEPMNLRNALDLKNEDFLKVIDKIWEYIKSGILAPGKDSEEPFFPALHLTENGKEFLEK